jgi:hypothetical protein
MCSQTHVACIGQVRPWIMLAYEICHATAYSRILGSLYKKRQPNKTVGVAEINRLLVDLVIFHNIIKVVDHQAVSLKVNKP